MPKRRLPLTARSVTSGRATSGSHEPEPRLYRKDADVWAPATGHEHLVAIGGALDVVPEVLSELVGPYVKDFGW